MGPDMYCDIKLTGTVMSKTTNSPIQGIKVTVNNESHNMGFTDENGQFEFYASIERTDFKIHFLDIDGVENGSFCGKTITIEATCRDEIKLNIELEEKE